jgi:adenylylsulfate kinase-like enzyme
VGQYEAPTSADLVLDTASAPVQESVERLVALVLSVAKAK